MQQVFGFDRIIDSVIDVPGGGAVGSTTPVVDIHVTAVPPPVGHGPAPLYRLDGEVLHFHAPGIAEYRCSPGAVAVALAQGADPDAVAGLLIATALPALVWMAGDVVLHAAAAVLPGDDRAVAICGPSGIGKSTILAGLLARGARLVADDALRLAITPAGVIASGLPAGYFLSHEGEGARRWCAVAPDRGLRRAPLRAVIGIERGGATPGGPTPLAGVAALELLIANRHRPRIPRLLRREPAVLAACAQIAGQVRCAAWHRADGEPDVTDAEWRALAASRDDR